MRALWLILATVTSEVSLCNRALQMIGAGRIQSLTDPASAAARACNSLYAEIRDEVMAVHEWQFAKARQTLAQLSDGPEFGYDYAYQLPDECLRALRLHNELVLGKEVEFEIEGDQLLCDLESDVQLHYIKRITDPSKFSAMFKSSFCTRLSSDLAMILKKDKELQKSQLDIYYKLLPSQSSTDARSENQPLPGHNAELGIFARARSGS